jgi:hypothetical protein
MQQLTKSRRTTDGTALETGESFYERFTSDFPSQNQNDNGCHFTEEMIDKDFVVH